MCFHRNFTCILTSAVCQRLVEGEIECQCAQSVCITMLGRCNVCEESLEHEIVVTTHRIRTIWVLKSCETAVRLTCWHLPLNNLAGVQLAKSCLLKLGRYTDVQVRVARGLDFQSPSTRGLFPCGEGAGYAGGIVSAAVDGMRVAQAVMQSSMLVSSQT